LSDPDFNESVAYSVRDTLSLIKSIPSELVGLLAVEAQLFRCTVKAMLKLCILIALFLIGGWLFFGATLVIALESVQAINLLGAMLIVAISNFVLGALAWQRLRSISRDLKFRESRASLTALLGHASSLVDTASRDSAQQ
jgi:O-antigen ligase